ncbi:MAG: galactose-1-phosphate uridylyltransferase [Thermoprotei archaeon]|nr:MAG: galactose-1-phosphate uridylyltransferase [Thermoprotei archaeon]
MGSPVSEPEIRRDTVLDRWVIVAAHRAKRPSEDKEKLSVCPFCPGNELMTPPASLVYVQDGGVVKKLSDKGDERVKGWLVRCFSNLYPALKSDLGFEELVSEVYVLGGVAYTGFGYHEVIVESPNHKAHPPATSLKQLELVMEAYFDVMTRLSYEKDVKYVCLFRNYKPEAGASLSHPHSQVIALPVVPSSVRREVEAFRRYNRERGGCILCDLVEMELGGPRLIYADKYFVVLAPWASLHPYEFWIIPRRHEASFINTHPRERRALARVLKATLTALKRLFNDPPYNYGFHVAPPRWRGESYHWHVEVYPKLAVHAGFELSTGMYINTAPPEKAAEAMRLEIERLGY